MLNFHQVCDLGVLVPAKTPGVNLLDFSSYGVQMRGSEKPRMGLKGKKREKEMSSLSLEFIHSFIHSFVHRFLSSSSSLFNTSLHVIWKKKI